MSWRRLRRLCRLYPTAVVVMITGIIFNRNVGFFFKESHHVSVPIRRTCRSGCPHRRHRPADTSFSLSIPSSSFILLHPSNDLVHLRLRHRPGVHEVANHDGRTIDPEGIDFVILHHHARDRGRPPGTVSLHYHGHLLSIQCRATEVDSCHR